MISAIIITKNEEKNIRDCLESVCWVDEIIVVDSFSTDKTVDICKEYTSHVYQQKWLGYGAQKNKALSYATGNWVLSIDADERVTEEMKHSIKSVVSSTVYSGFKVKRQNYFLNQRVLYGNWAHDCPVKFFRKSRGKVSTCAVHEYIQIDGKIGVLNGVLKHFSYDSYATYFDKMQRYTSLWAAEKYEKGRQSNVVFAVAHAAACFIRDYIFKRGFLDRGIGLSIAICSAIYTYFKYIKLSELSAKNR